MELWDVLDENGNKTGRLVERGKPMEKGDYHLVVFSWIVNSEGNFLISKRSQYKLGAGKWEPVGGAVIAGETSLQGALREVKEELGICLNADEGIFIKRLKFDTNYSWFGDIWLFNHDVDLSEVVLQKEEVSDVGWATKDEILNLIHGEEFFNGKIFLNTI